MAIIVNPFSNESRSVQHPTAGELNMSGPTGHETAAGMFRQLDAAELGLARAMTTAEEQKPDYTNVLPLFPNRFLPPDNQQLGEASGF